MSVKVGGILQKWTNYMIGWRDRYFELENGILSYYKLDPDSRQSNCRGAINIQRAEIRDGNKLGFEVVLNDNVWYLRAKVAAEKQKWLDAFQRSKQISEEVAVETTEDQGSQLPIILGRMASADNLSILSLEEKVNAQNTLKKKIEILRETYPLVDNWKLDNPKEVFIEKHIPQSLKCPVCFEVFYDLVYQCSEGHGVCSNCFSKISSCPVCRKSYGGTRLRNRLIEDLVVNSDMQCPGSGYGCRFKARVNEMEQHVVECPWFLLQEKLEPQQTSPVIRVKGIVRESPEDPVRPPDRVPEASTERVHRNDPEWLRKLKEFLFMSFVVVFFSGVAGMCLIIYVISFLTPTQFCLLIVMGFLYSLGSSR